MLKDLKESVDKQLKETRSMTYYQIENSNKETGIIKRNQTNSEAEKYTN